MALAVNLRQGKKICRCVRRPYRRPALNAANPVCGNPWVRFVAGLPDFRQNPEFLGQARVRIENEQLSSVLPGGAAARGGQAQFQT
jgi:hypothetical protein